MGYVEKDFSFLYFYLGSYKGFWLLSRNFCQIRKKYVNYRHQQSCRLVWKKKSLQFSALQDAAVKLAAAVMEIAVVIIKKTLAYLAKLSSGIDSIFTASFPD